MYFKILVIKRIPVEDVSVAITTKFKSYEQRMKGGQRPFLETDGYSVYFTSTMVSDTEDAKLLIYTERDDVEEVGNSYLSQALDNLKILCDMNEYPCVLYEGPMEHTAAVAATKDVYRLFPDDMYTIGTSFGLSEAECDHLEAELNGTAKLDGDVAEIPTDTEFVIDNSGDADPHHEQTEIKAETVAEEDVDDTAVISKGIDIDDLANKIAARLNHKSDTSYTAEKEIISSTNILKTQTETLEEWAIRVYLTGADVESDVEQIHSKIKGLLLKSLAYVCKATESAVVKRDAATATPDVKETEIEESEPEANTDTLEEKVEETEKTIYSDNDDTEDESNESVSDSSEDIMMQVARESSSDTEFFNGIKKYRDMLSTEALDSIAKYKMYDKLILGTNEENSFVTYTKRKTVLGI